MLSIRGATTITADSPEEVISATTELLQSIIIENKLQLEKITAVFFTCTRDITSAYPAKAARDLGITQAALMCLQEMYVENSLDRCIRICVFYNEETISDMIKHIYLNNAVTLRPDLLK